MSHVACVYTEANGYKGQMFCAFNCGIIRVTKTHNISLKGLIEKSLLLLLRKTFFAENELCGPQEVNKIVY